MYSTDRFESFSRIVFNEEVTLDYAFRTMCSWLDMEEALWQLAAIANGRCRYQAKRSSTATLTGQ